MFKVTTVNFRNNLREILEKVSHGEQVILKYYDKEFSLKPIIKTSSSKSKPLSKQAKKILKDIESQDYNLINARVRKYMPELLDNDVQKQKAFIKKEMNKKYEL